ncbi:MAG: radical SAM protein [Deltaproteobacteria bacterium]|uniref:Radical SAM protein n=1 Tax=Candidatus Zymogenus saltonus TaxID=2844893 RepID=A0A9D8KGT6_9DELT|nr:radical SAM protein [Candidatus Zymogenus saltonus]
MEPPSDDFIVTTRERKTSVLKKGTFGCLKGIASINITMGCLLGCVYCYARGYPGAPGSRRAVLFDNLPEKLESELSRKRERVPNVLFNTASDSFQPHPDILRISVKAMEILLSSSIPISFLTKGVIPRRFFDMVSGGGHSDLVTARIGVVSLSEDYRNRFEPHAATPAERLKNIEGLMEIGVKTEVRIDPVIPFVTDSNEDFDTLFRELAERGIKRVAISYLHLRPAIEEQFRRELDRFNMRLIEGIFTGSGWESVGSSTRSKLVSKGVREKGYDRAREAADKHGIRLSVCSCKNPDMPGEICTADLIRPQFTADEGKSQLSLPFS